MFSHFIINDFRLLHQLVLYLLQAFCFLNQVYCETLCLFDLSDCGLLTLRFGQICFLFIPNSCFTGFSLLLFDEIKLMHNQVEHTTVCCVFFLCVVEPKPFQPCFLKKKALLVSAAGRLKKKRNHSDEVCKTTWKWNGDLSRSVLVMESQSSACKQLPLDLLNVMGQKNWLVWQKYFFQNKNECC